jgi:hypothetical protein
MLLRADGEILEEGSQELGVEQTVVGGLSSSKMAKCVGTSWPPWEELSKGRSLQADMPCRQAGCSRSKTPDEDGQVRGDILGNFGEMAQRPASASQRMLLQNRL